MVRPWKFLLSTDPEGDSPIHNIRFGRVEEGNKRKLTVYITNLEPFSVEKITATSSDKDLEVLIPSTLESYGVGEMTLTWSVGEKTYSLEDVIKFRAEAIKEIE